MKKSRAVVKSDNTDKIMNFLNGTVSEQRTDTQQSKIFTKRSMYDFIKSFYPVIVLPDIDCLYFIDSDPLRVSETLGYIHFELFGCGVYFSVSLSKEKKCLVTGVFRPYSGVVFYQKVDPVYFDFTEIYSFFEEEQLERQSDSGQSEEQSDSGQSEEQSDSGPSEEQSDSGQSEEQSDSGQSEEQSDNAQSEEYSSEWCLPF